MYQHLIRTAIENLQRRAGPPRVRIHLPGAEEHRVALGTAFTLHISAPREGYLSLLSFGTGGTCCRLYPAEISAPPAASWNLPVPNDAPWIFIGPTTARTGAREILLALVTAGPAPCDPADLHPALPGPPGDASQTVPRLFTLSREAWDYGLLSLEITQPRGVRH